MAIDERSRHQLHARLEEVLGPQEAAVLMEHLPPVGWADVATKRDLDHLGVLMKRDLEQFRSENQREHEALRADFKLEHEALEHKLMAAFRGELLHQTRTFMLTLWTAVVTAVLAVGGLAFAAARLV
jgi:hypothetical protein